ncbi:MAG TPA: hypothetical protein VGQ55_11095, partial [Pyrinomonadaceae bacterium]|nr:hypothetical protein [Pyrinomonadaceae bacterium]
IINSTIVYNSSNGTNITSAGGLVALNGRPEGMGNSILAKNTGRSPDFYGRGAAAYSLIGIIDPSFGMVDGVSGNIIGSVKAPVDPMLDDLDDNGGAFQRTHSLPGVEQSMPEITISLVCDRGNHYLSINAGIRA